MISEGPYHPNTAPCATNENEKSNVESKHHGMQTYGVIGPISRCPRHTMGETDFTGQLWWGNRAVPGVERPKGYWGGYLDRHPSAIIRTTNMVWWRAHAPVYKPFPGHL